jgi:hypothetical protein
MIVRIKKRENPFALVDKRPLCDARLSWKARGILAYLLSKPDDWQVVLQDLVNMGTDGIDKVRGGLQELKRLGYARLEILRDESGRAQGKRWVIFELPVPDSEPTPAPARSGKTADVGKKPTSGKTHATENDALTENEPLLAEAAQPDLFSAKGHPELPPTLSADAALVEAWGEWKQHRRQAGNKLTPLAMKRQIAEMEKWGPAASVVAIHHSIAKNYRGLFPPRPGQHGAPATPRAPITRDNVLSLPKRPA